LKRRRLGDILAAMSADLRRRVTSWVAICAILLNTFAPALSHALASERGLSWLEICSQAGVGRMLLPDAGPAGEPTAPHAVAFEHCPYCTPHGGSAAAPPPTRQPIEVAAAAGSEFPAAAPRPRAPLAWLSAPARAPPSVS
jgi:hypothetical protein